VLKLGTISLDGTRVHADVSKRNAVSYKHLLELETQPRAEVEELFALSEQVEVGTSFQFIMRALLHIETHLPLAQEREQPICSCSTPAVVKGLSTTFGHFRLWHIALRVTKWGKPEGERN